MRKILLAGTAVLLLAGPALAQEVYESYRVYEGEVPSEIPGGMSLEELMDSEVYGVGGEDVAEVEDLAIAADGQVRGVILDVGGFLGIGDREVMVPFDRIEVQGTKVVTNMTEEELEALPEMMEEDGRWMLDD